jgi:DHA3 family macrolide efflux protein-like MFS transporter
MNTSRWAVRFGTIWTGQTLSLIGSSIASFGLIWWLTETTGSTEVLATATLATFIPVILFRPIAGTLVDRWSRKWILVCADAAIALVSLWLAWMFWRGAMEIWHVYAVAIVRSLGEAFHVPAMKASTTLLVPERHLTRLSGINQTVDGGLKLVGPLLGALAISLLPLHGVMMIDVVTAAFAIAPVLFLAIPQPQGTPAVRRQRVWTNLQETVRYLRAAPGLLILFGWFALANALGALAYPYLPLYIVEYFEGGAFHLASIQSGNGIGYIVGGLLFVFFAGFRRKTTTIFVAASVQAIGGLLLAFSPPGTLVFAIAGMCLAGLMNTYVNAPITPLLQANVPHEMQGRILSMSSSISYVLYPIGVLLGAFLVGRFGIRPILQATSSLLIFTGLLALVPSVRDLEEQLIRLRRLWGANRVQ